MTLLPTDVYDYETQDQLDYIESAGNLVRFQSEVARRRPGKDSPIPDFYQKQAQDFRTEKSEKIAESDDSDVEQNEVYEQDADNGLSHQKLLHVLSKNHARVEVYKDGDLTQDYRSIW